MSTIKARKSSPKKVRPTTATVSMTKTQKLLAPLTVEHITTFNIIQELNNEDLDKQECQVENERLKVTCYTLNNKVSITEDLQRDKDVLTKRLEESEAIRDQQ